MGKTQLSTRWQGGGGKTIARLRSMHLQLRKDSDRPMESGLLEEVEEMGVGRRRCRIGKAWLRLWQRSRLGWAMIVTSLRTRDTMEEAEVEGLVGMVMMMMMREV